MQETRHNHPALRAGGRPSTRTRAAAFPALLAGLAMALACTGGPRGPDSGASGGPWPQALSALAADGSRLAWHGLALGMTLDDAERTLGAPIPLRHSEVPVCGSHFSEVLHRGRLVTLQFSGDEPAARLESLYLPLPAPSLSVGALTDRLADALPPIRYQPSRHQPELRAREDLTPLYVLAAQPDQAVLLKPEEGLYLALAGCFD